MTTTSHESRRGILLVAGSALVWSFGGTISRFLEASDSWTVIFWRSIFAALFLLCFMLWRDGPRGTLKLFKNMGLPGLGVALCFAIASIFFVIALAYTTVANILLMQAAVWRKNIGANLARDHCSHCWCGHHGVGLVFRQSVAHWRWACPSNLRCLCHRNSHHPAACPRANVSRRVFGNVDCNLCFRSDGEHLFCHVNGHGLAICLRCHQFGTWPCHVCDRSASSTGSPGVIGWNA
jgi:hypothetical protein